MAVGRWTTVPPQFYFTPNLVLHFLVLHYPLPDFTPNPVLHFPPSDIQGLGLIIGPVENFLYVGKMRLWELRIVFLLTLRTTESKLESIMSFFLCD